MTVGDLRALIREAEGDSIVAGQLFDVSGDRKLADALVDMFGLDHILDKEIDALAPLQIMLDWMIEHRSFDVPSDIYTLLHPHDMTIHLVLQAHALMKELASRTGTNLETRNHALSGQIVLCIKKDSSKKDLGDLWMTIHFSSNGFKEMWIRYHSRSAQPDVDELMRALRGGKIELEEDFPESHLSDDGTIMTTLDDVLSGD